MSEGILFPVFKLCLELLLPTSEAASRLLPTTRRCPRSTGLPRRPPEPPRPRGMPMICRGSTPGRMHKDFPDPPGPHASGPRRRAPMVSRWVGTMYQPWTDEAIGNVLPCPGLPPAPPARLFVPRCVCRVPRCSLHAAYRAQYEVTRLPRTPFRIRRRDVKRVARQGEQRRVRNLFGRDHGSPERLTLARRWRGGP